MHSPHTRSEYRNIRKPKKLRKRIVVGTILLIPALIVLAISSLWTEDKAPESKQNPGAQKATPIASISNNLEATPPLIDGEILNRLENNEAPTQRWKDYTIKANDTFDGVLSKLEVPNQSKRELIAQLGTKFSLRHIRPGHTIRLFYDHENKPVGMRYQSSPVEIYEVNRTPDGFKATSIEVPIEVKKERIGITLTSSLSQNLNEVGESSALIQKIVDILAWDIDFFADPRKGDAVSLLVEKKFIDGKFYQYGRVLAVDYDGSIVKQKAFYFEPTGGYYDENGQSLARNFLKSPVMYTRISSKFGRRRHPVTHRLHNHLGTDYAAPTGAPVWALADGRVTKRAYTKFNGNYIAIKHNNGYSTYYLHLSGFAKGLKVGKRVEQKQLIGYVGATGRATGPHLHLSVKYGKRFIDPLKLKRVKRTSIKENQLAAFKRMVSYRTAQLQDRPDPTKQS
jgi:murein DD-endopeptidase MepM/ murein hydrolase activator NlpD